MTQAATAPATLQGGKEYQAQLQRIQIAPDAPTLIRQGEQIRIAHEMRELSDQEADNLRLWFTHRRGQLRTAAPQQQAQQQQRPQQGGQQGEQQRQGGSQQQGQASQGSSDTPVSGARRPGHPGFWAKMPAPGGPDVLTGFAPQPPAPFRRPLAEIVYDLRTKVHPAMVEQREQGGSKLDFISWSTRLPMFDLYAPGWTNDVRNVYTIQGLAPVPPNEAEVEAGEYNAQPLFYKPAKGNPSDRWHKPREVYIPTTHVCIVMRVTIPAAEGDFYHEATGWEDMRNSGFGDPYSNASAMAICRAFSMFGQGLTLYFK